VRTQATIQMSRGFDLGTWMTTVFNLCQHGRPRSYQWRAFALLAGCLTRNNTKFYYLQCQPAFSWHPDDLYNYTTWVISKTGCQL